MSDIPVTFGSAQELPEPFQGFWGPMVVWGPEMFALIKISGYVTDPTFPHPPEIMLEAYVGGDWLTVPRIGMAGSNGPSSFTGVLEWESVQGAKEFRLVLPAQNSSLASDGHSP